MIEALAAGHCRKMESGMFSGWCHCAVLLRMIWSERHVAMTILVSSLD